MGAMNEIKFNSQICTTKEQSQRLLDLGLNPETADMSYYSLNGEVVLTVGIAKVSQEIIKGGKVVDVKHAEIIPAWSLHRLMELLDSPFIEFTGNPYEEVIYNISECVKYGYLDKEYLKQ